eukprot:PhM_4_TR7836/c0_g1_i1/m.13947
MSELRALQSRMEELLRENERLKSNNKTLKKQLTANEQRYKDTASGHVTTAADALKRRSDVSMMSHSNATNTDGGNTDGMQHDLASSSLSLSMATGGGEAHAQIAALRAELHALRGKVRESGVLDLHTEVCKLRQRVSEYEHELFDVQSILIGMQTAYTSLRAGDSGQ